MPLSLNTQIYLINVVFVFTKVLRGQTEALYVMTKSGQTRYEFIFTNLVSFILKFQANCIFDFSCYYSCTHCFNTVDCGVPSTLYICHICSSVSAILIYLFVLLIFLKCYFNQVPTRVLVCIARFDNVEL